MLTPPKVDSLGRNTIYYWPNVEVRDDSDDEDEDNGSPVQDSIDRDQDEDQEGRIEKYLDDVDIQNDRARE